MLVLTRRIEECLIFRIGQQKIKIKMLGVDDKTNVRIGINAPSDILIDREETYIKRLKSGEIQPLKGDLHYELSGV